MNVITPVRSLTSRGHGLLERHLLPVPSMMQGCYDRSRRSLTWLNDIQGGNAGAWFEEIPLNRSQIKSCGIVPWTSAEVTSFVVRHWLGLTFSDNFLIIKPNLFSGTTSLSADLRFRKGKLKIGMEKDGERILLKVNGKVIPADKSGAYKILITDL